MSDLSEILDNYAITLGATDWVKSRAIVEKAIKALMLELIDGSKFLNDALQEDILRQKIEEL